MNRPNDDLTRSNETNAASGKSGPSIALIAFGVLAVIVIIFILRNETPSELDFMIFDWDTTVRWSIFVSIVLGVVLDRLFSFWWRRKRTRKDS
jgi:uncharacterized integral membrane protein